MAGVASTYEGRRAVGVAILTGAAYLLLAQYGLWISDVGITGAFWPAAGVTVAALLLTPRRTWWLTLAVVGFVELGNDLAHGLSLVGSASYAVGDVVNPLLAAWLVTRRDRTVVVRVRSVVRFVVLGAFASSAVAGAIAAAAPAIVEGAPYVPTVLRWIVGDGIGILTITPAIVINIARLGSAPRRPGIAALVVGSVTALALVAFTNWGPGWDAALPYVVGPAIVMSALLGLRVAGATVALTAAIGNLALTWGYEPFGIAIEGTGLVVPMFQLYLGVTALSTLVLAAKVAELDREEGRSARARANAERQRLRMRLSRSALEAADEAELEDAIRSILARGLDATIRIARPDRGSSPNGDRVVVPLPHEDDAIVAARPGFPFRADELGLLDTATSVLASTRRRLRAEATLGDANRELAEALRIRDDILSVVSHELRTPLTPILGFAELLVAREPLSEQARVMVETTGRNARRMLALVDDLLVASRLRRGTADPVPKVVRVASALDELLAELGDVGAGVDTSVPPELEVRVDPRHLKQILTNLLTNARRYGAPPFVVSAEADAAGAARIVVRDHGEGVPAAFREHLFDRFTQGSVGSRRESAGLGLGLFIAQSLARRNGGDLWYEDDDGAAFHLRLPRVVAASPGRLADAAVPVPAPAPVSEPWDVASAAADPAPR